MKSFLTNGVKKIEGKKYGYIKMSEILADEFISYATVSGNDVLKKINREVESNIDLQKLFTNNDLSVEENEVKAEILIKLEEDLQIVYDDNLGFYIDRNKPVLQSINNKDLCTFVNNNVESNQKIKHPNDMLNISEEITELKSVYVGIMTSLGLDFDFSKKTPKFWKVADITFKVVPEKTLETKVKKIFTDYFLISDINKIIDSEINEVREEYNDLINSFNLEYDSYEKKWFDMGNKTIRKTLILTPEKYMRQEEVTSISLDRIKEVNKHLVEDLKSMLTAFTQEV